jgi:ABC-type phosphate transport system substrate-binding protein
MRIRATAGILLCCFTLTAALACSSQPAAPSSLGSPTVAGSTTSSASQQTTASASRFGDRTPGVVYVTSQGLYYDTFVVKDPLPMHGRFQLLANGETEFGPGQPGYLGGRWWEDTNGNRVQDAEDHYFLCPLLPPGRSTP